MGARDRIEAAKRYDKLGTSVANDHKLWVGHLEWSCQRVNKTRRGVAHDVALASRMGVEGETSEKAMKSYTVVGFLTGPTLTSCYSCKLG